MSLYANSDGTENAVSPLGPVFLAMYSVEVLLYSRKCSPNASNVLPHICHRGRFCDSGYFTPSFGLVSTYCIAVFLSQQDGSVPTHRTVPCANYKIRIYSLLYSLIYSTRFVKYLSKEELQTVYICNISQKRGTGYGEIADRGVLLPGTNGQKRGRCVATAPPIIFSVFSGSPGMRWGRASRSRRPGRPSGISAPAPGQSTPYHHNAPDHGSPRYRRSPQSLPGAGW